MIDLYDIENKDNKKIQVIYDLLKYCKLEKEDICDLIKGCTINDINYIIDIVYETSEFDTDDIQYCPTGKWYYYNLYINKKNDDYIYKAKNAKKHLALNGVQIKYIYIISNLFKLPYFKIAEIFNISEITVGFIKNKKSHKDFLENIYLEDYLFLVQ